jgi:hypothetical protein
MADFTAHGGWLGALVAWVVTAIFIHFAAKIVLDKSSFLTALLVALIGTLLAFLVVALVGGGTLGIVLGILTWAVVCSIFYRTGLVKAAVVGLVAWVLFFLTTWLIAKLTS